MVINSVIQLSKYLIHWNISRNQLNLTIVIVQDQNLIQNYKV